MNQDTPHASTFIQRDSRWAGRLLFFLGPWRLRMALAIAISVAGGAAFSAYTHSRVRRMPKTLVLEYDPGTMYLSRYLGKPLEDGDPWEADPAEANRQPNLDRFLRNLAARIKQLVDDERTKYSAYIQGIGACELAGGWPFISLDYSYRVTVDEFERADGKPQGHCFRAGQDGNAPERLWGWMANAVCGATAMGLPLFGLLTLVVIRLRRLSRSVTGFPVIVTETPTP